MVRLADADRPPAGIIDYMVKLVEYDEASPEVRAVYDDIMATRQTDWINNFWKALAADPVTLKTHLGNRSNRS